MMLMVSDLKQTAGGHLYWTFGGGNILVVVFKSLFTDFRSAVADDNSRKTRAVLHQEGSKVPSFK